MKQFRINPVIRISLGLSLLTLSLLLGVEMLGVLPDPHKTILDSRKKTCESLAVYASLSIRNGDIKAIQTTLDVVQRRNDDIGSAALRRKDGVILTKIGDHDDYWNNKRDKASTLHNVQVPIFKDGQRWGTFEVSFKALHASVFMSLWNRPIVEFIEKHA